MIVVVHKIELFTKKKVTKKKSNNSSINYRKILKANLKVGLHKTTTIPINDPDQQIDFKSQFQLHKLESNCWCSELKKRGFDI